MKKSPKHDPSYGFSEFVNIVWQASQSTLSIDEYYQVFFEMLRFLYLDYDKATIQALSETAISLRHEGRG